MFAIEGVAVKVYTSSKPAEHPLATGPAAGAHDGRIVIGDASPQARSTVRPRVPLPRPPRAVPDVQHERRHADPRQKLATRRGAADGGEDARAGRGVETEGWPRRMHVVGHWILAGLH